MTTETLPGSGEQESFTVYTEHPSRASEDRKHFRQVPLLCHRNRCEMPGESSGPLKQTSKSQTDHYQLPPAQTSGGAMQGHANMFEHSGPGLLNPCRRA